MEILFKRLKSNFELPYFYSDSPEGIKTQIWIVLIAHLLFSVIHRAVREAEHFTTLVAMAANNLGSLYLLYLFDQCKSEAQSYTERFEDNSIRKVCAKKWG